MINPDLMIYLLDLLKWQQAPQLSMALLTPWLSAVAPPMLWFSVGVRIMPPGLLWVPVLWYQVVVVQSLSCLTLCDPMDCSTPVFPVLHHLPELAQTHVHWVSDAISSSVVPFSSCLQSFPASGTFPMSQSFTSGGQNIGVSASTSVLPMHPGLISFRMDWLDLPALQGTLKSLLQNHSSKAIYNSGQFQEKKECSLNILL